MAPETCSSGPNTSASRSEDCKDKHYESQRTAEKGCYWCHDRFIAGARGLLHSRGGLSRSSHSPDGNQTSHQWMVKKPGVLLGHGWFIAMRRNRNNMCGIATDAIYGRWIDLCRHQVKRCQFGLSCTLRLAHATLGTFAFVLTSYVSVFWVTIYVMLWRAPRTPSVQEAIYWRHACGRVLCEVV